MHAPLAERYAMITAMYRASPRLAIRHPVHPKDHLFLL